MNSWRRRLSSLVLATYCMQMILYSRDKSFTRPPFPVLSRLPVMQRRGDCSEKEPTEHILLNRCPLPVIVSDDDDTWRPVSVARLPNCIPAFLRPAVYPPFCLSLRASSCLTLCLCMWAFVCVCGRVCASVCPNVCLTVSMSVLSICLPGCLYV